MVAARLRPDPAVAALVEAVSRAEYEAVLAELTAHTTRHSLSPQFRTAAGQAAERLQALGYEVELTPIDIPGGDSLNVVASRAGSDAEPRNLVFVMAHLDSINTGAPVDAPAPGADDNASGAAGVLEIARALAGATLRGDLRLILFGGEEQGLFGSVQYVAGLGAADRARTEAAVNMDMIARRNVTAATVLLEGGRVSQPVIDLLAEAAATYTALAVTSSLNPFNSDHVPFIDAGIPTVLTIEGNDQDNHDVHSIRDTVDRLDLDLAVEILRMNVAAVATAAGVVVEPGPGPDEGGGDGGAGEVAVIASGDQLLE